MEPLKIIIIGAVIVFGPPAALGLVLGLTRGWVDGLIAGVLSLAIILGLGHRYLMSQARRYGLDQHHPPAQEPGQNESNKKEEL